MLKMTLNCYQYFFSVAVILPKTNTPDGCRYLLIRTGCYDPSKISIQDIFKVSGMLIECLMQEDDNFIIAGQMGILDFSGVTLSHFIQFNPGFIKKSTMYQQDAVPVREKGSHFVKMPQIALTVFNLFMSFLNEKNRSRVGWWILNVKKPLIFLTVDFDSWRWLWRTF